MATALKSVANDGPGRPRENVRTGDGYRLAEYLDANWKDRVGMTNDEVAIKLGYRSANIVSMWRLGKTKVALERLGEVAELMKVDLAILLPLWFEQQLGEPGPERERREAQLQKILKILDRTVTANEFAIVKGLRKKLGRSDPAFTKEQVNAAALIASNEDFAEEVLKLAASKGLTV